MNAPIDLSSFRPELIECDIMVGEKNIVIEDKAGLNQLVLPLEYKSIIGQFDGEKSVKDIISTMYAVDNKVSVNSIIKAIHLLNGAKFLKETVNIFDEIKNDKGPHEHRPNFVTRPLHKIFLINKFKIKFSSSILFIALSLSVIFSLYLSMKNPLWKYSFDNFLKFDQFMGLGYIKLFIIISTLLSLKGIAQSLLLLSCVGSFSKFSISFNFFAISFSVADKQIFSHDSKFIIVMYRIVSSLIYLAVASIFIYFRPESNWVNDIKIMAIVLTFIDFDPYKESELTKLFQFFYADNQLKDMMPYLKNCTLTATAGDDTKIGDEIRYMGYSILAILWAVVFTLFSIDLLVTNLPRLIFSIQIASWPEKISSVFIIIFLVLIFGNLFLDLASTILKNLLAPFQKLSFLKKGPKGNGKASEICTQENVREFLHKNLFFSGLSEAGFDLILEEGELGSLKKGRNLILQGTTGKEMFVILKGSVEVNVREGTGRIKKIVELRENAIIGEIAILKESKRTANVVALEDIVYFKVQDEVVKHLLNSEKTKNDYDKIISRVEISRFVSTANIFKDFPPEVMNIFVESGDLINFPKGHNIVAQGEKDKTFYLLLKGEVEILKDGEICATLGQGSFFGEVALLADVPRTADVKSKEDCLILFIEDKDFWRILSNNLDLAMYIESVGRNRMEEKE
jgi:CRP-like cAMP-binding protein